MTQWRSKQMPLSEWAPFQDHYENLFMALGGDKRLALFMRGHPADYEDTLLIPSYIAELVEALSPGGWEDHLNPQEKKWVLLVGNADAPKNHGITLGSDE